MCDIRNNEKEPAAWGRVRGLLMFPLGDRNTESVISISGLRPTESPTCSSGLARDN